MTKAKGLKNPAAIAAVPIVTEQVGKAGKAAGQRADKINADTKGALSWVILGLVVLGVYGAWKITAPFRAGAGVADDILGGVSQTIRDLFSTDDVTGIGQVSNLANPSHKPAGATINVTQAASQASQLLTLFGSSGTLTNSEKQQVYAVFLNKTPVDYQMLSAAFGTPLRNSLTGGHTITPAFGKKMNLKQWLDAELGSAGVNFLRTITHGVF